MHWNCCIEEMRSLLELCNSMSADRTGMAASRFLVFVAANVIVFCVLHLRVVNRILIAA